MNDTETGEKLTIAITQAMEKQLAELGFDKAKHRAVWHNSLGNYGSSIYLDYFLASNADDYVAKLKAGLHAAERIDTFELKKEIAQLMQGESVKQSLNNYYDSVADKIRACLHRVGYRAALSVMERSIDFDGVGIA